MTVINVEMCFCLPHGRLWDASFSPPGDICLRGVLLLGAGGMTGMATAIPILVDLCSKAPPGTNFVFGDCPTNILLPAPPPWYRPF